MGFKVPSGINKVPFSIRVDENDFEIIDKLSKKSKKSYNYIVNSMINLQLKIWMKKISKNKETNYIRK